MFILTYKYHDSFKILGIFESTCEAIVAREHLIKSKSIYQITKGFFEIKEYEIGRLYENVYP